MIAHRSYSYFDVKGKPVRRQTECGPQVYRGGKWHDYADLTRLMRSGQPISYVECKKLMKDVDALAARRTADEKSAVWHHSP